MPLDPRIALAAQSPIDINRSFQNALTSVSGVNNLEQQRLQAPVQNRLLEARASTAEAGVPSDTAIGNQRQMEIFKSLALGAREVIGNSQDEALQKLITRKQRLASEGKDTTQTDQSIDLAINDFATFQKRAQEYIDLDNQINAPRTQRSSVKSFAPVTVVNPDTKEKRLVTPTFDPNTGVAELKPFDIPENFEISRETPEERRNADVLASDQKARDKAQAEIDAARRKEEEKVTGKGLASRRQDQINKGLDAADSVSNVNRGIELLNNIETGGFENFKLRAKQLFGVEAADEAELSNRLGKAVLSQLRTTFGAAFTEKEGDRLDRIEARFGKSTEGNKRLLRQTKRIIERVANRGIKAARSAGDSDAAEDIQNALDFSLSEEKPPRKSGAQPASVGRFQIRVK